MIKAIGFNAGALGDLVMQTVVCRAFKEKYPNSHLILGIGDKYKHCEPLFYHNKYIDEIHIWNSYDNWPQPIDTEYIDSQNFDIVCNAMPQHTRPDWYNHYHYCEEYPLIHGLQPPKDISCYLNPYFEKFPHGDKMITLSMFPSFDKGQEKSLSIEKLEELCIWIKKRGFIPVQLGGKYEPKLENADRPDLSIIGAAQLLYSSKLHITADTSFSWIASAYKHPTIGVYTNNLPGMNHSWSHQPINNNAYYFHRRDLNILTIEEITYKIKEYVKN